MNKYIIRLLREWIEHKKIIIAVDFDSTISPWGIIDNKEDMERCIKLLQQCQKVGCFIIAHTACREDRYEEVIKTFNYHGLHLDQINRNPIELPYGNNSKPYFNILLDDRAGFVEAMDILESAMYNYIGITKPIYDEIA